MTRRLDAVQAMPVGSGALQLGLQLAPELARATLDYQRRFSTSTSAFASAWLGSALSGGSRVFDYGAVAGLRVTF